MPTSDGNEPVDTLQFAAPWRLDGQVALVTGGSSGLGLHLAKVLHRAGARVAIAARDPNRLTDALSHISSLDDDRLTALEIDVQNADAVDEGVAELLTRWGQIDILVNNAGVTALANSLELEESEWDQILDTNLKGAWLMSRAVGRVMVAQSRGSIINMASIFGLRTGLHLAAYNASKAGLIQLTKTMAAELARHSIRVNALAPGYIQTEMTREFLPSPAGEAVLKRIPSRRFGALDDLNGPLLLLASDASRHMTGTVIPVDGGHLISPL